MTQRLKAITHDLFSLGVGLYLVLHVPQLATLPNLILVAWLSLSTNKIIDVLGHTSRNGFPARSFWTHSIFTAPIWGTLIAIASLYLMDGFIGQAMTTPQILFAVCFGVIPAYSHLLLDALTESGVYLGRKRIAFAHLRYDNLILNGAFAGLGMLLVLAAIV